MCTRTIQRHGEEGGERVPFSPGILKYYIQNGRRRNEATEWREKRNAASLAIIGGHEKRRGPIVNGPFESPLGCEMRAEQQENTCSRPQSHVSNQADKPILYILYITFKEN